MFNKIAIIGVGLIGGSLALALRKNVAVKEISGCSRTQDTVFKALGLGIMDEGSTDIEEVVKGAEIIVLCTPLGTYGALAKEISRHMDEGAILTDAGSVKGLPSEDAINNLSKEQASLFVPAHPIAGTENSGPDAAFSELFEGKNVIITPLKNTDKAAIEKVKTMWQKAGANVTELDIKSHDFIYAHVSHNIQFLSSAFALAIANHEGILSDSDINFKKFIRLFGSDPVMWRDIFLENTENLKKAVELFKENITSLVENIDAKRLEAAKEKRLEMHTLFKGHSHTSFRESEYENLSGDSKIWIDIMPRLISCAIIEGIDKEHYEYASGAGLHGFTKNIILDGATDTQDILDNSDAVKKALGEFVEQIDLLVKAIEDKDSTQIEALLGKGKELYQKIN